MNIITHKHLYYKRKAIHVHFNPNQIWKVFTLKTALIWGKNWKMEITRTQVKVMECFSFIDYLFF